MSSMLCIYLKTFLKNNLLPPYWHLYVVSEKCPVRAVLLLFYRHRELTPELLVVIPTFP